MKNFPFKALLLAAVICLASCKSNSTTEATDATDSTATITPATPSADTTATSTDTISGGTGAIVDSTGTAPTK